MTTEVSTTLSDFPLQFLFQNSTTTFWILASQNKIDDWRFLRMSPEQQIHNKLQVRGTKYINQLQKGKKI